MAAYTASLAREWIAIEGVVLPDLEVGNPMFDPQDRRRCPIHHCLLAVLTTR